MRHFPSRRPVRLIVGVSTFRVRATIKLSTLLKETAMSWAARRQAFRRILEAPGCVHPASVFDPLSARIAQHIGFELGMFAGSTASLTVMGAPDIVLLTATEFAQQAQRICRAMDLPLLVDADHGYGTAMNVARTIEDLAIAGIAAATIEDTLLPAPFGAAGKSNLIPVVEGVGKMRAALAGRPDPAFHVVGRTSAPLISNLDDTIARLRAYEQAGVDALFIVGLKTVDDLRAVSSATKLPLIIGGAIANLSRDDLAQLRVRICLQGHLPIMAAVQAIYDTMKALRDGTAPAEIKGTASASLMRELTKQAAYDAQIQSFMR
jgi:carboxyvinyl-carboxyphosphonate phosphorylmutase